MPRKLFHGTINESIQSIKYLDIWYYIILNLLFKLSILLLYFNWDYDVYNDAKNNEDLVNTALLITV